MTCNLFTVADVPKNLLNSITVTNCLLTNSFLDQNRPTMYTKVAFTNQLVKNDSFVNV